MPQPQTLSHPVTTLRNCTSRPWGTLKPRSQLVVGAALLSLSLTHVTQSSAAPVYSIVDLGALGGQYSAALGLNEKGAAVGQASLANGNTNAFVSAGGQTLPVGPSNVMTSDARAINSTGTVVGTANASAGSFGYISQGGSTAIVPPIPSGPVTQAWRTYANDINDLGQR